MAKYDVELITDKHGKPMPQYFDEQEGIMKPITHDNFNGTINGSVDVEFPDVQKVKVTNPADYPTELNVNVNNPVDTVSVDNLPDVQRVEVTNTQEQLDVNVLNPVDSVSVNNLPTDYPDKAVEARLQAIEQTQSQILDKLNDTIDTRLTGSIVEQGIKYRSPETTIVFDDVIDGAGELHVLYDTADIPRSAQSIGVSMTKNSQTDIKTEVGFFEGNTLIQYRVGQWKHEFIAVYPVVGNRIRIRVRDMTPSGRNVRVALTYFYAPQEQYTTEKDETISNLGNAITSLGGSV